MSLDGIIYWHQFKVQFKLWQSLNRYGEKIEKDGMQTDVSWSSSRQSLLRILYEKTLIYTKKIICPK